MQHHPGIDPTVVKWHAAEVGTALTPSTGSGQAPTLSPREREIDQLRASGNVALTFVLSTDDVDRHGDVVSVEGWRLEAYLRNPVLLWAHDYRHPAIGRAVSVWTEPHRLLARMEFAPTAFAQEVAALYNCGYQWGVSVGFRPIRWEERRDPRNGAFLGLRYLEQELLEVSAVPVPANRQALRRNAEGDLTLEESHPVIPAKAGIQWQTIALGALLAELGNHCLNQDSRDKRIFRTLLTFGTQSCQSLNPENPDSDKQKSKSRRDT